MKSLRIILQILLPLVILAAGGGLAWWIKEQKPAPKVDTSTFLPPLVRTHEVTLEDQRIDIDTQGTVEPFRKIQLAAQVGGRVVAISPALRAGGFFAEDDVLVKIDTDDFDLAVVQQQAAVKRAELRVLQEKAEAEAAMRAWRELEGAQSTDPLVRREPQVAEAESALAAARAQLAKGKLDRDRCVVKAPFAGRVRSANIDVGQIVQPGAALAQIYGTDHAEVRLPLPANDTAFLDLPLHWSDGATSDSTKPSVELTADFGGQRHSWQGTIVRTEGEVDRKTRQLMVVARVDAPYARGDAGGRPPLAVGTFVRAEIRGRTFPQIARLPLSALNGADSVWVIGAEHRLQRRQLEILRTTTDFVYVRQGLAAGEIVCTTPLEAPVDGMPVRLLQEQSR